MHVIIFLVKVEYVMKKNILAIREELWGRRYSACIVIIRDIIVDLEAALEQFRGGCVKGRLKRS
jgi:hypothetical protein